MLIHSKELLMGGGVVKFDPVTFTANGTWEVPKGVKRIRVDMAGSAGSVVQAGGTPGYGGRVQCVLSVTPKQILYIYTGLMNTTDINYSINIYDASDIRTVPDDLNSRLIVAGAGGSTMAVIGKCGDGGDFIGGVSNFVDPSYPVTAGTQTSAGANAHYSGSFGYGGAASVNGARYVGKGGAGWYGGGGTIIIYSSGRERGTGSAGGSSYTNPNLCSEVIHTQGFNTGRGYVTISMV